MTTAALLAITDDNSVSPGVLGFVVVALIGVATFLLIRSMRHQLRKIDLPDDRSPAATEEDGVQSEERGTPPRQ